jgi:hypothetical protein
MLLVHVWMTKQREYALIRQRRDLLLFNLVVGKLLLVLLPVLACGTRHAALRGGVRAP